MTDETQRLLPEIQCCKLG